MSMRTLAWIALIVASSASSATNCESEGTCGTSPDEVEVREQIVGEGQTKLLQGKSSASVNEHYEVAEEAETEAGGQCEQCWTKAKKVCNENWNCMQQKCPCLKRR